ncbi:MAG TPA: outer membrane beta-barrel protein [Burkholderiales bacterium]|nr:outer membrane beta-barrel protein [Burkholderiales bacterium]
MRIAALLLAALACVTFSGTPRAQSDLPPSYNLYLGAGSFKPSDDAVARDGLFNLDFGFGGRYSRHLAWEVGWVYYYQDTNTPAALGIQGLGSDKGSLTGSGFGGLVKLVQPVGSADFYVGAGLGYYASELSASTINPLTFQIRSVDRRDKGWGTQYVAGMDLRASPRFTLGIQYRRVVLDADFGPGIGTIDNGGGMWQLLFRSTFGTCNDCGG